MPFAQLVIGPPGAGKSTYCNGMHQFLGAIGRKCSIVNLDPANDKTSYPCALDVRDLVTLEEVMSEDHLGPNGGILYAMEEVEQNYEWLEEGLKELGGRRILCDAQTASYLPVLTITFATIEDYVLFDCPGQVEIFTHHSSLRNIFFRLQKLGYRVRTYIPLSSIHLKAGNPILTNNCSWSSSTSLTHTTSPSPQCSSPPFCSPSAPCCKWISPTSTS